MDGKDVEDAEAPIRADDPVRLRHAMSRHNDAEGAAGLLRDYSGRVRVLESGVRNQGSDLCEETGVGFELSVHSGQADVRGDRFSKRERIRLSFAPQRSPRRELT
jgi:hypothetical protein